MSKLGSILATTLLLHASTYIECNNDTRLMPPFNDVIVTNPARNDGFGGQFQTIIYSVIFAELCDMKFLYSPFRDMEHNYDNDPEFIQKKETLINFIGNFAINDDIQTQSAISAESYVRFFENNLEPCVSSAALKRIKEIFRANKNIEDYFNPNEFNIAIHVRRPNPHDNRIQGTDTPDATFTGIIDSLREIYASKHPKFHIYSQGNINKFKDSFTADDIVLHLDESLEQTFTSLVLADVLVTSPSSLSYTAGLISNGAVYYIRFWHPPLPNWNIINY